MLLLIEPFKEGRIGSKGICLAAHKRRTALDIEGGECLIAISRTRAGTYMSKRKQHGMEDSLDLHVETDNRRTKSPFLEGCPIIILFFI